jgi:hypothetical protein
MAKNISPSKISNLLAPVKAVMHETSSIKVMGPVDDVMSPSFVPQSPFGGNFSVNNRYATSLFLDRSKSVLANVSSSYLTRLFTIKSAILFDVILVYASIIIFQPTFPPYLLTSPLFSPASPLCK